jgi:hypothetical protein
MKKIIVLFSLLVFMTGVTVSLVASPIVSMVQVTDKDPKKAPSADEKKAAPSSEKKMLHVQRRRMLPALISRLPL